MQFSNLLLLNTQTIISTTYIQCAFAFAVRRSILHSSPHRIRNSRCTNVSRIDAELSVLSLNVLSAITASGGVKPADWTFV